MDGRWGGLSLVLVAYAVIVVVMLGAVSKALAAWLA